MRTLGKIIVWIVVLIILAFVGLIGLAVLTAQGNAEAIGWIIGLGALFGLPLLAIATAMLLVGAVLITSQAKTPKAPRLNPDDVLVMPNGDIVQRMGRPRSVIPTQAPTPREQDPLRAAFRPLAVKDRVPIGYVIIALRVLAIVLFGWFFGPEVFMHMKYGGLMGAAPLQMIIILVPMALLYAILPLILWLASNLLKRACMGNSQADSFA
jgi:hypothetical protein